MYDSIVLLCLQTPELYVKLNIIQLTGWANKFSAKLIHFWATL